MTTRFSFGVVAAALMSVSLEACVPAPEPLQRVSGVAQGTTYSLQWSGDSGDASAVAAAVDRELDRLDRLLSNYRADSVLEGFNASQSTEPQSLPAELVSLLELAKTVHEQSSGCFDPSVRPLVHAWGFDTESPSVPTEAVLAASRARVGLRHLEIIDAEHVRKLVPDLEIDMSSIGQGYSADRLAAVLEENGVTSYLAEIGGEMVARGSKPDGSPWRIGVERPDESDAVARTLVSPESGHFAVVTSGTYRHFFEVGGKRLSHIIDPRTARPVEHALRSVTVAGHEGATAAAWGTALLCLGPEEGPATAARHEIAALFFSEAADGALVLAESPAFEAEWPGVLRSD
jgi:thiamine biosynthesis lipoprotein